MSAQRGNVYTTRTGQYGIRWREHSQRRHQSGFRTKTDARNWFRDTIAPRLSRGAPSGDITFDDLVDLFLDRHAADVAPRTISTLAQRLAPARSRFGGWKLTELEGAATDIARWRAGLPDGSRFRHTHALRQVLAAAVRWRYMHRNPAVEAGRNPKPRREELRPFTRDEIDNLAVELGPVYGPLVIFAAETGLRTNEWVALERRDIDRHGPAVTVQRRYADGRLVAYPKTVRSRRRVPLTSRALNVVDQLPPRLDTPLLFPARQGGHIELTNFRVRDWYPALEAAGVAQRGPYTLRHTFATEALAGGVSIFELARLMGSSVAMIDDTYGHLARDSDARIRAALETRSAGAR